MGGQPKPSVQHPIQDAGHLKNWGKPRVRRSRTPLIFSVFWGFFGSKLRLNLVRLRPKKQG